MTPEFLQYWNRLLKENPVLSQDGMTIRLTAEQFKKVLSKAHSDGRLSVQAKRSATEEIFENSLFGQIFGK